MDISSRPSAVKIIDFLSVDLKKASPNNLTPQDIENTCAFPVGNVTKSSEIFIFSVTCPFSANSFIRDVVPELNKGSGLVLANFVRSDNDLNVWVRISKLKYQYRMGFVADIYKAAYDGKIKTYDQLNKFIDEQFKSVPLSKVNPYHSVERSSRSALATTATLNSVYRVTSTPFKSIIK